MKTCPTDDDAEAEAVIRFLDYRTQADERRKELVSIRKQAITNSRASLLHAAQAPRDMIRNASSSSSPADGFFRRQRERAEEDRRLKKAAEDYNHGIHDDANIPVAIPYEHILQNQKEQRERRLSETRALVDRYLAAKGSYWGRMFWKQSSSFQLSEEDRDQSEMHSRDGSEDGIDRRDDVDECGLHTVSSHPSQHSMPLIEAVEACSKRWESIDDPGTNESRGLSDLAGTMSQEEIETIASMTEEIVMNNYSTEGNQEPLLLQDGKRTLAVLWFSLMAVCSKNMLGTALSLALINYNLQPEKVKAADLIRLLGDSRFFSICRSILHRFQDETSTTSPQDESDEHSQHSEHRYGEESMSKHSFNSIREAVHHALENESSGELLADSVRMFQNALGTVHNSMLQAESTLESKPSIMEEIPHIETSNSIWNVSPSSPAHERSVTKEAPSDESREAVVEEDSVGSCDRSFEKDERNQQSESEPNTGGIVEETPSDEDGLPKDSNAIDVAEGLLSSYTPAQVDLECTDSRVEMWKEGAIEVTHHAAWAEINEMNDIQKPSSMTSWKMDFNGVPTGLKQEVSDQNRGEDEKKMADQCSSPLNQKENSVLSHSIEETKVLGSDCTTKPAGDGEDTHRDNDAVLPLFQGRNVMSSLTTNHEMPTMVTKKEVDGSTVFKPPADESHNDAFYDGVGLAETNVYPIHDMEYQSCTVRNIDAVNSDIGCEKIVESCDDDEGPPAEISMHSFPSDVHEEIEVELMSPSMIELVPTLEEYEEHDVRDRGEPSVQNTDGRRIGSSSENAKEPKHDSLITMVKIVPKTQSETNLSTDDTNASLQDNELNDIKAFMKENGGRDGDYLSVQDKSQDNDVIDFVDPDEIDFQPSCDNEAMTVSLDENKAIAIQANIRRWRAASKFAASIRSVIKLQSVMRLWLVKNQLLEKQAAVTQIQKIMRGHSSRVRVWSTMHGVVRFHANMLLIGDLRVKVESRKKFGQVRMMNEASGKIQRITRGYLHKQRFRTLVFKVVTLQALWRGSYQRHLRHKREELASKIIQAAYRGFKCQSSFKNIRRNILYIQAFLRKALERKRKVSTNAATAKIQKLWRGAKTRLQLSLLHENATSVQSIFRRHLVRRKSAILLKSIRESRAAISIQAVYRGHTARNSYEERTRATKLFVKGAIVIQSFCRAYAAQKCYKKILQSTKETREVTLIQAIYRGQKARRWYNITIQCLKETRQATMIQSIYRGYIVRKNYNKLTRCLVEAARATLIQTFYRGYRARQSFHGRQMEVKLNNGAIAIQAIFRGFVARRTYQMHMFERRKVDKAVAIQAILRGAVQRQRCSAVISAAIVLQSWYRGAVARRQSDMVIHRVQKIQAWYRSHQTQQHYTDVIVSVTKIQSAWRGYSAMVAFQIELGNIITVQSVARNWLVASSLKVDKRKDPQSTQAPCDVSCSAGSVWSDYDAPLLNSSRVTSAASCSTSSILSDYDAPVPKSISSQTREGNLTSNNGYSGRTSKSSRFVSKIPSGSGSVGSRSSRSSRSSRASSKYTSILPPPLVCSRSAVSRGDKSAYFSSCSDGEGRSQVSFVSGQEYLSMYLSDSHDDGQSTIDVSDVSSYDDFYSLAEAASSEYSYSSSPPTGKKFIILEDNHQGIFPCPDLPKLYEHIEEEHDVHATGEAEAFNGMLEGEKENEDELDSSLASVDSCPLLPSADSLIEDTAMEQKPKGPSRGRTYYTVGFLALVGLGATAAIKSTRRR